MTASNEAKEPNAVPWRLIDASADMMNMAFCNDTTPNPFRSSLALFAYEPPIEEVPVAISCDRKIVFLKVSCSITGYQPDGDEQSRIVDYLSTLPSVDLNDIEQITRLYLACYGVLLNISVFPGYQQATDPAVPSRDTLIYSHACVGVRIFSEARRAAQRRSRSAVKQRNAAAGKNAAQPKGPGRFWPPAALRHRPGSSGYRTGTAPSQMAKTGLGRRRGNKSVVP